MRSSKSVVFFVVLSALLLSTIPTYPSNHTKTVTMKVVGEAVIYDQDIVTAKKVALEDAFRKAVRKTVGTWVTAESFTRNFVSIEDSILTRAKGYIKTYETLDVNVSDNFVKLSAKVTVSVSPLQADLASLLGAMDEPRFIILSKDPFVKETLEKELKERGFPIILCLEEDWEEKITQKILAKIYQKCFAEILVSVELDVDRCTKTGNIWSYVITLSAESFWLDTARRLVDSAAQINGAGVNKEMAFKQAIRRGSPKLVNSFIERISEAWSDLLLNGRLITVSVTGVSYKKLINLRDHLNGIFGVREVVQRKFEKGVALMEVRFTGSSTTLADLISKTDFRNVSVIVTTVERGKIFLKVVSG